jgi:hypothetical protein
LGGNAAHHQSVKLNKYQIVWNIGCQHPTQQRQTTPQQNQKNPTFAHI